MIKPIEAGDDAQAPQIMDTTLEDSKDGYCNTILEVDEVKVQSSVTESLGCFDGVKCLGVLSKLVFPQTPEGPPVQLVGITSNEGHTSINVHDGRQLLVVRF